MRKKLNSNKKPFYPVSSPYITKKDIESVNRALKRGWISSDGPEIKMEIKVAYKNKKI